MGNGAKLVEKPVPKLGKLKGTKVSLRIKSFLDRASEPVPRHTMDSRFCCHFLLFQILTFCSAWGINLEMERWQIHIYTWYIDIFTSAIGTRWSFEYQISFHQDLSWHSLSIRKYVWGATIKNLAPTLFCMNQCITRITWFFSCSLQVFVLNNNYQNYVELESIATRKQQKKLLEILTAFRSTIS